MNLPVYTGRIFITVVSSCSTFVNIHANASSIGFKPVLTCLNTFRNQIMAKKRWILCMLQKISSQAFLEKILKTHKIFSSVDKKVTFHKRQTYSNSDLFE